MLPLSHAALVNRVQTWSASIVDESLKRELHMDAHGGSESWEDRWCVCAAKSADPAPVLRVSDGRDGASFEVRSSEVITIAPGEAHAFVKSTRCSSTTHFPDGSVLAGVAYDDYWIRVPFAAQDWHRHSVAWRELRTEAKQIKSPERRAEMIRERMFPLPLLLALFATNHTATPQWTTADRAHSQAAAASSSSSAAAASPSDVGASAEYRALLRAALPHIEAAQRADEKALAQVGEMMLLKQKSAEPTMLKAEVRARNHSRR